MKVLHVLHVASAIPYFLGDQINYFGKDNDIYIACTSSNIISELRNKWNFKYININIYRKISILNDLKSICYLIFYINKYKIDIIVGHSPKGALIAAIAGYICKVKSRIYIRHGLSYETATGFNFFLLINIERITSFFSTKIICVSASVLNISRTKKLTCNKKLKLLNLGSFNGIDTNFKFNKLYIEENIITIKKKQFNILKDDIVIGFVARLNADKGFFELLSAWNILKKNYDNIKLLIVGSDDERQPIGNDIYNSLKSDTKIIFTGFTEDTRIYYALMNIFILPSYREGMPTVVLEASSMCLPVITSKKTGCIDSIIENVTGIFTDINPNDICKKISFYIDNSNVRLEHGINGRKFVEENFDQSVLWEYLKIEIYK